jgi:putative ABC transport system permease protein
MKDQDRLWKLMSRKLAGEASKEELEELQRLLQKYPEDTFAADMISDMWKTVEQEIQPDMEQVFAAHQQRMTEKLKQSERHSKLRRQRAQQALWKEISIPKGPLSHIIHTWHLLGNYFKTARRSLSRNLTFSVINITGLAIGIAGAIILLLLVEFQLSVDQFHKKKDRIYLLLGNTKINGEIRTWFSTPMELAPVLKLNYPEVEEVTRINWVSAFILKYEDKRIQTRGMLVDPGFLNIFDFPLLKGNTKKVLNNPHDIVITESLSKKMFGATDPMGKTIKIDSIALFTVTGVLKDIPKNTQFEFEYLVPYSYMKEVGWYNADWGNGSSTETCVLLKPGITEAKANQVFGNVITAHASDVKTIVFVHPMRKWRLWSNFENGKIVGGAIQFVRLFSIIAAFILLIACINYMNLSTARSVKRGKEVGIRKVAGAGKGSLVGQFLWESILYSFIAGIIALILVESSLGWFNKILESSLALPYGSPYFWLTAAGFIVFTGIIAGSYPAFYLSAYKPIRVLKGIFKGSHALVTPRKVLVVVQFTFAITFIICTFVIYKQLAFGRKRDVGFDKTNLVFTYNKGDVQTNYIFIRNELLASGAVTDVTRTNAPVIDSWYYEDKFDWKGKDKNIRQIFTLYQTDKAFTKTVGLKILAGRDIDLDSYPADSTATLVNEAAVKVLGFKNPVGQYIKKPDGKYLQIVGVIKDFISGSPYEPVFPMVVHGPEKKMWFGAVTFRLNTQHSTSANLKTITAVFKKYNPDYPFEYHFVDQSYTERFQGEETMGTLAAVFAGLTIFISCLGLFALATYMAESRIKEIGIRKVLGASVATITTLLSKDFLKLVVISFLIASPLAGWLMYNWLQRYEYRIPLSWWIFAGTGLISILIAVATVGYQSLKAALANPVKSLRSE